MKIPPVNTEDLESYPLGQHPFGAKNPSPQEIQAFEKFLNGRDTNGLDFSPSQSGDALRAVEEGFKPRMLTTTADSPALQEALTKTESDFKSQFTAHAESSESFHALLSKAFGNIDVDAAEKIRLQTLDGDFSWLPKIELISGDPSFQGAYSAEEGTVFLNQSLFDDPAEALRVLTEEIGHHLETLVRKGDSPGDEGELFRRLFAGETLSGDEIAAIQSENDHGVIHYNGRDIKVEFDDDTVFGIGIIVNDNGVATNQFDQDNDGQSDTINNDSVNNFFDEIFGNNNDFITKVKYDAGKGVLRLKGADIDIQGVTDNGNELIVNGRSLKLGFNLVGEIDEQRPTRQQVKNLNIATEEGFGLKLTRVQGTHNNYEFQVTRTPYDELAQSSGIPWQEIDQAYLELIARGLGPWADLLQNDGVLPPLNAYEPGSEIETTMRAHYNRLAQQVADNTGLPLEQIQDTVDDLYTRDGIQASNLLQGKLDAQQVAAAIAETTARRVAAARTTIFDQNTSSQTAFDAVRQGGTFDTTNTDAVRDLQENLVFLGYTNSNNPSSSDAGIDGTWGPGTMKAISSFQSEHGLADTGILDQATLAALDSEVDARITELSDAAIDQQEHIFNGGLSEAQFQAENRQSIINTANNVGIPPELLYSIVGQESSFGVNNNPRLERGHLTRLTSMRDHLAGRDLSLLDPTNTSDQQTIDQLFASTRGAAGNRANVLDSMVPANNATHADRLQALQQAQSFSDRDLRELSTSWGYGQILGWRTLGNNWQQVEGADWRVLLDRLQNPDSTNQIETLGSYMQNGQDSREIVGGEIQAALADWADYQQAVANGTQNTFEFRRLARSHNGPNWMMRNPDYAKNITEFLARWNSTP